MDFRKNIKTIEIETEQEKDGVKTLIRDKIYLKKGMFGWKVVYPIQNEDLSINWKNLISGGHWINLIIIGLIVLIILGCIYEYSEAVDLANKYLNQIFVNKTLTDYPPRLLP
jgi:hypothetical protein